MCSTIMLVPPAWPGSHRYDQAAAFFWQLASMFYRLAQLASTKDISPTKHRILCSELLLFCKNCLIRVEWEQGMCSKIQTFRR